MTDESNNWPSSSGQRRGARMARLISNTSWEQRGIKMLRKIDELFDALSWWVRTGIIFSVAMSILHGTAIWIVSLFASFGMFEDTPTIFVEILGIFFLTWAWGKLDR